MPGRGRQSIAGGHVRGIGAGDTTHSCSWSACRNHRALEGAQFRAVDGPSARASIAAASAAAVRHVVYVSVAHPAPIMRGISPSAVTVERQLRQRGLVATILRPWYILGPKHWWPLALLPVYRLLEHMCTCDESSLRLGLISIRDMLAALLWSIEHPPVKTRVIEVPELRRLGGANRETGRTHHQRCRPDRWLSRQKRAAGCLVGRCAV